MHQKWQQLETNDFLTIFCINNTSQFGSGAHICVDELLYLKGGQTLSNGHTLEHKHIAYKNDLTDWQLAVIRYNR